jgi:hypothetical protein
MKKLIVFIIVSFLLIFVFQYSKKIIAQSDQNLTPIRTLTPSQLITENENQKKMFFSYLQESIDDQNKIIYINLSGSKDSKSDAIDLQLSFNNNIEIKEIIDGDSFPIYPRKIIERNRILITGLALNEQGIKKLARSESNFVKIKIFIKDKNKKSYVNLDRQNSKIFLAGQEITDIKKLKNSFKQIIF